MNFERMNLYDYLAYCNGEKSNYKFVGVITRQQSIICIENREKFDYLDIVRSIHDKVYPGKVKEDSDFFSDSIVYFSDGNDLTFIVPEEINSEQYNSLKRNLRLARSFEYDYDKSLFMVDDSMKLIDRAKEKIKDDLILDEKEVIIGTILEKEGNERLIK